MRTIRECIKDSTDKLDTGTLSIALSWFLRNMAVILVFDTYQRLGQEVADVFIDEYRISGKIKENPDVFDYTSVLKGDDLMRSMAQGTQLQGFLEWWLDKNEPIDEESLTLWYDLNELGEAWNDYALQKKYEE